MNEEDKSDFVTQFQAIEALSMVSRSMGMEIPTADRDKFYVRVAEMQALKVLGLYPINPPPVTLKEEKSPEPEPLAWIVDPFDNSKYIHLDLSPKDIKFFRDVLGYRGEEFGKLVTNLIRNYLGRITAYERPVPQSGEAPQR